MKIRLIIFTFILVFSMNSLAVECKLSYYPQTAFETKVDSLPEIRDLSKTVNRILKLTVNTLEKADDATLGLVSAIATGGTPIEMLRPTQWDKLNISGTVIYQDMPFSGTALKGIKMTFTESKNTRTITTGAHGEFSESFSKLVPYSKLRLFPVPFFYRADKNIPTMKIPITVKIDSKFCTAESTLDEVPLEPLVFIVSKKE